MLKVGVYVQEEDSEMDLYTTDEKDLDMSEEEDSLEEYSLEEVSSETDSPEEDQVQEEFSDKELNSEGKEELVNTEKYWWNSNLEAD
jgi:hypothetical protein